MVNSVCFTALVHGFFITYDEGRSVPFGRIPMKFRLFLFGLLAVPAFAFAEGPVAGNAPASVPTILPAGASVKPPADAPKITAARPKFDFGNVEEGPDITHEFIIRNRGKSVLKINNVSTSCGCTAAVEDKKEILPGGRGKIKATYHTQG